MYGIYNAKLFNRIAAFLVDCIIILVVFVAVDLVATQKIANKVWGYDNLMDQYEQYQIDYGIAYFDTDGNLVYNNVDSSVTEAFQNDQAVQKVASQISWISVMVISINLFVGELIAFLILPLIFKNGKTVGKLLMHMGLATNQGVRIKFWQLLARFLIGIFAVETVLSLEFIYLLGIPVPIPLVGSAIVMFATKRHQALHDLIAGTQVVDTDKTIILDSLSEREAHAAEYAQEKAQEEQERRQKARIESQNTEIGLYMPKNEDKKQDQNDETKEG